MEALIVIAVLALVVWVVGAPLRRARAGGGEDRVAVERDALLAAKEAKYREIRELELDHRTGKLSEADFRAQDRARRAEAIEILHALDDLEPAAAAPSPPSPPPAPVADVDAPADTARVPSP